MRAFSRIMLFSFIFFYSWQNAFNQEINLRPPLDIPLFLSGNYGELRSTHFHAGIDLKTEGLVGKNVYAVDDGYVSRIKISSGGYGNALYITHNNGYTSVYGHLLNFNSELDAFLKEGQYRRKKFEVDMYLKKEQFPVSKGQLIALSGNTGSSGGPHLHFEYRTPRQVPTNGLKYKFPIQDNLAPEFRKLVCYFGIDKETYTWQGKEVINLRETSKDSYTLTSPVLADGTMAFGVEVYDFLNGSTNKCGVYTLKMFINNKLYYSFEIDHISFTHTKFIKTHMDYAEKKLNSRNVHRLFIEPGNRLKVYKDVIENGLFEVSDSLNNIRIEAYDVYGNKSELNFKVLKDTSKHFKSVQTGQLVYKYSQENVLSSETFKFNMPAYSMFSDKTILWNIDSTSTAYYSPVYSIGDRYVPLSKYPELSIQLNSGDINVSTDKLLIVGIDSDGELKSEGGRYANNTVQAKVTGFGKYAVAIDTTPPLIRAIGFVEKKRYYAGNKINFNISDDLSGIKTYNGYIDGNWALFEFDGKSGNLSYTFDADRFIPDGKLHKLKLYVMDERKNMQVFEGSFYY